MLYENNKFCIGDSSTLLKLTQHISQPRLAVIRDLTLLSPWYAHPDGFSAKRPVLNGRKEWKGVVATLGQFKGLRTLHVAMHRYIGTTYEERWLGRPLEAANIPFTFIVTESLTFSH